MEAAAHDPTTPSPTVRPHLVGLDGLRGLAILAVLLHHLLPPNYPEGIPGGFAGTVIKAIYRVADTGWWGVDLFFVLSGFLITGILLDAKGTPNYFGHFYARRSLRIFPLYYGVLAFIFCVLPWLAATPATMEWVHRHAAHLLEMGTTNAPLQAWLWFYGTNIRIALEPDGWIFGGLTHFWSLAVEEHFYLVWPLVVFLCTPRTLVRVCLAVALSALLFRAGFLWAGMKPAHIYVFTPCRIDGMALGALVATLLFIGKSPTPAPTRAGATPAGLTTSLGLLLGTMPTGSIELLRAACSRLFRVLLPCSILTILFAPRFGSLVIIFGHTLLALTFATALPAAALARRTGRWSEGRWLCLPPLLLFGKLSYGLYILHPLIIDPVGRWIAGPAMQAALGASYALTALLRVAIGLPLSLAAAWIVWHLFEKHFLRLKSLFPSGERAFSPGWNDRTPSLPLGLRAP